MILPARSFKAWRSPVFESVSEKMAGAGDLSASVGDPPHRQSHLPSRLQPRQFRAQSFFSLASHEIDDLTRKYGSKIFQSYLENNAPAAGRLFWAYGPDHGDITVLAIEPHPEDQKRGAYLRLKLSSLPSARTKPEKRARA